MAEKTEVQLWQTRVREGQEYRRIYGRDREWRRYRNYFRHNWMKAEGGDYLPLNIIFAMGKAMLPQVMPPTPGFVITPTKPFFAPQARVLEALDNWLLRILAMPATIRRSALHAYLYGTGPIKFGFDREYGTPSEAEARKRRVQPGDFANRATPQGNLLEFNKLVFPGMPWMLPSHPGNFIVPWGAEALSNSPWCSFRVIRSLESVKKDPLYRKVRELKPTWFAGAPIGWSSSGENKDVPAPLWDTPSGHYERPESEQFLEMFEIHDLEKGKIRTLSMDHDTWLRDDENVLLLDGLPADALIFNEDDEVFWGNPDCRYLEPQQLEMNDILTQWQKVRRSSVPKVAVDKDKITPDEAAKLNDETVRALIMTEGNPREALLEFTKYEGQGLLVAARFVWENVREMMGFSRNQLGEFDTSSRRTATEANAVREAHMLRMSDRRASTADLLIRAVHKLNQIVFYFWTQPMVMQVVGQDGLQYWVSFTGPQLAGEFDYKIDLEAGMPQTRQVRKMEAMEAFKALNGDPYIDQIELRRALLSSSESLNVERLMAPAMGGGMGMSPTSPMPFGQFAQQTMAQPHAQLTRPRLPSLMMAPAAPQGSGQAGGPA